MNLEELEKEWASKYPTTRVVYNAQYKRPRDPRTFIFDRSFILEDIVNKYKLRGRDHTDTMYKILIYVINNLKYVGDKKTKKQAEFWQNPEDTATLRKGDCEDGAILIKSLSLISGVPDWRVRICAGDVKGGGHAYCTYVRDDGTQCVLDWCYWPTKADIDKRRTLEQEPNYYSVWFSFNRDFCFGSKTTEYGPRP